MRRRESRRRSRHNRTSKSPAMWPGFLAAQIVREYSLLLIFLCKIFPEKLDKARGGRRGILDSPFQSTPPARGATAPCASCPSWHLYFNPRPPRGGRRRVSSPRPWTQRFQSTPPARGATRWQPRASRASRSFQSTPPARGATVGDLDCVKCHQISIHAPREGGDRKFCGSTCSCLLFQSTPPARGATCYLYTIPP